MLIVSIKAEAICWEAWTAGGERVNLGVKWRIAFFFLLSKEESNITEINSQGGKLILPLLLQPCNSSTVLVILALQITGMRGGGT